MWTEGHRLLREHPATTADISAWTGCTTAAVKGWRSTSAPYPSTPREPIRVILEQRLGIPRSAWASTYQPTAPAVAAPTQPEQPDPAPPFPIDYSHCSGVAHALYQQCERLWLDLYSARGSEFGRDETRIVKLETAYAQALERAAKADGKLGAVEEHRLTKTLTFRQHCDRILRALEPHPEARAAVLESLQDV